MSTVERAESTLGRATEPQSVTTIKYLNEVLKTTVGELYYSSWAISEKDINLQETSVKNLLRLLNLKHQVTKDSVVPFGITLHAYKIFEKQDKKLVLTGFTKIEGAAPFHGIRREKGVWYIITGSDKKLFVPVGEIKTTPDNRAIIKFVPAPPVRGFSLHR